MITYQITVQGRTADDILARAHAILTEFYGETPYVITEAEGYPLLRNGYGDVALNEARISSRKIG